MTFAPYEIPTGGVAPPVRLMIDEVGSTRWVANGSPWMLLIERSDGSTDLLRIGQGKAVPLEWTVKLPKSETADVDARDISRANAKGRSEYWETALAEAPPFDADEAARDSFAYTPPSRWWLHRRELDHGRVLHLQANGPELELTVSTIDLPVFEGQWLYYAHHHAAWRAALGWNGWGDPPDGWNRHMQSGRRRKDGTAATEYLRHAEGGREFQRRGGW